MRGGHIRSISDWISCVWPLLFTLLPIRLCVLKGDALSEGSDNKLADLGRSRPECGHLVREEVCECVQTTRGDAAHHHAYWCRWTTSGC
jgi:hypothetical protein